MKKLMTGLTVLSAAILLAVVAVSLWAQDYKQYCNRRFGLCLEHPAGLTVEPPPANDDGRVFSDGQGLRLTASGSNNVMDETLKSERFSQERQLHRVTS